MFSLQRHMAKNQSFAEWQRKCKEKAVSLGANLRRRLKKMHTRPAA